MALLSVPPPSFLPSSPLRNPGTRLDPPSRFEKPDWQYPNSQIARPEPPSAPLSCRTERSSFHLLGLVSRFNTGQFCRETTHYRIVMHPLQVPHHTTPNQPPGADASQCG